MRRWMLVVGVLLALAVLVFVWLVASPPYWSRAAWGQQLATAESIRDYDGVTADAPYAVAVDRLGKPDYFGPGFRRLEHVDAGVAHWEKADGTELRCLIVDDRLVGTVKVGKW